MARASEVDIRRVAKCTRLANLLLFLRARPNGATLDDIRTEVDGYADARKSDESFQRQLRRDRADLERMGYTIEKIREAGDGPSRFSLVSPPRQACEQTLDIKEMSLLRLCALSALDDPSFPMREELARALRKLRMAPDTASIPSESDSPRADAVDEHVAGIFVDAICSGEALSFSYAGTSAPPSKRQAIPLRVFSYLGALYTHAFDIDKRACRSFRLERIVDTPIPVEASDDMLEEARGHVDDRLAVLPFQIGEDRFEAVIYLDGRLSGQEARLTEGLGDLAPSEDGFVWRVPAADPARLARWIVENGPGLHLIEPAEAADILVKGLVAVAKGAE